MTELSLIDSCINGDMENFDILFGQMFDHYNCFFTFVKDAGSKEPTKVLFNKIDDIAEFEVDSGVFSGSTETLEIRGCKVVTKPCKQTTKVQVTRINRKR